MTPFDEHGAFRVSGGEGLRRVAVRGAGVTALSQSLGFSIQMIATIVLARLLSPSDFGLIAIVTTFSLLLMNVGFNGVTEAVVQRDEVDHRLASNLFWITSGVGAALTVGFAGAGALLARFYGDERVASVAAAMSATIVLSSVSVVHLALLKRAMRFTGVSTNDVVARAASVAVSIACALAGWGYWALVAGAIALGLATSIGAWMRCRWMPGAPRRVAGTGQTVRFALNTFGHFAVNYCTRNFDNFLVGWVLGPQALGFYKKAYDLSVLPVGQLSDPLSAVAMPVLCRVAGDRARYRRYTLRALSTIAFVGMALSGGLALAGKDLMLVLLGPRWEESGRIFTFFAPGIGALLLYVAYIWIHLSVGRPDRLLRWGIAEFAVLASSFVAGLRWGPVGVATAWGIAAWTLALPALCYAGRPAGLDAAAIVGAVWKYVAASVLAAGAVIAALQPHSSPATAPGVVGALERMLVVSTTFAAFYLAAVILLHKGLGPLKEIATLAGDMLPARVKGKTCLELSVS